MDGISSITTIDQKMAEMRIKNLELLKRHQEIEEDRQLAEQSGATTSTVEYTKDTMRGTTKTRGRHNTTQQHSQENQQEQIHRPPVRRKYDNDRTENSTPRVQKVDYNRLKHERAQETTNHQRNNSFISAELREYAYPCYYQSENNHDADEPAHAKKLVIVNNQVTRIGSGRFIQQQQQQRSQEQGQRRREERMRRTGAHNNGHPGGPSEFHLDISQIPMWQNNPMPPPPPPIHLQLLPTNINGHPTDLNHLMNNGGDQLDQSAYMHNFMYTSSAQSTPFNGNGTVYFAHPATPMAAAPPPSAQSSQTHFHQFHPTRTFENSNRHQFHHSSHFQSSPVFQPTPPVPPAQILTPSSSSSHIHQQQDNTSMEVPPRFRRLKRSDQDNKYSQSRPMSGDFDQIRNSSSRFTNENRYQSRPQSFYDFSSQQQQQPSNNFFRSSSNNNNNLSNRHQRNNNNTNSLPLSAYMNTDENSYSNENSYWGTSTYQRRRSNQHQRNYHQDKHQFPLSLYDPRQYGFNNNYSRRNDFNNRSNSNRRLNNNNNNNNANSNRIDDSNDIDLIEEWWEDDNPELIGTNQTQTNLDSQTTTTVDDSGNSSLSTSMHLKESTLDDDENNRSINDSVNQPSDASITDNNIIESLDKLQQQLKFEEAVDNQLTSEFLASNNETTAYDTAHFLQWAKEKFREELAGRLTAKEIEQHDAVTSDDNDDEDIVVTAGIKLDQYQLDQVTDDDIDNHMDELEDDLNEKLIIEEKLSKTIVVE